MCVNHAPALELDPGVIGHGELEAQTGPPRLPPDRKRRAHLDKQLVMASFTNRVIGRTGECLREGTATGFGLLARAGGA